MPDKTEVTADPTSLTLLPGETGEITANVRNLGQTVDQLLLSVDGVDPSWYTIPVASVALFPNDQDSLKINVHPPRTVESGTQSFRINIASQEDPEASATTEVKIEIKALLEVDISITPESLAGRKATYQVVVNNPGDHEATVNLVASDQKNRLRYRFHLGQLGLDSNGKSGTKLEVRLGWMAFLGGEKPFEFKVAALPPGEETTPDFCPYCGNKLKHKPGVPTIFCSDCEKKLNEKAKAVSAEFVRMPLIKGLPRMSLPSWFSRKPIIRSFEATTEDKREFKLSWSTKRAKTVTIGDESAEVGGEKYVHPTEVTRYTLTASNKRRSTSQTVEVHPLPIPKQASERIRASLTPAEVKANAGTVPVQATLQLQNLGEIVDKFLVEVAGIDPSWYNRSASSVALMPQATDQVQITFQPPKKEGVRAGIYPFAIVVRSESVSEDVTAVTGQLEILPAPEFKLQIRPVRITCRRKGKFRVGITNTGVSDVAVGFEITDMEEGCRFKLKDDHPAVPAWKTVEIPMITRPKRGWFIGQSKLYNISVTATDDKVTHTATCDLTHNPLFKSWRSLFRVIRAIIVIAFVIVAIYLAIHWGGGLDALFDDPGQWADDLVDGTYSPW